MAGKEISYEDARQRAEQCARKDLSNFGIHPTIPLLEGKYAENSTCWIFFRSKAINIPAKYAMTIEAGAAYAISKWGGFLYVKNNMDDAEQLKIQMDRFETIRPAVNPSKFNSVWGVSNPFQEK
jgi:hypothetical protein